MISLFLIAGRAQYFLQPEFQRIRAGVGDHPEGHHCHGPRPVLQQPPAADGAVGLTGAGLEQPLTQVRSTATRTGAQVRSGSYPGLREEKPGPGAHKRHIEFLHSAITRLCSPPGTV